MPNAGPGQFKLDLGDERLWRDGQPVRLTNKAFRILRHFVQNPNRLITKDEMFCTVWSGLHVSEGLVKEYVHDLRVALHDDPKRPRFIETVHGRGYRFLGGIEVLLPRRRQIYQQRPSGTSAIAVLPFLTIGDDPYQAKLADLIVEGISTSLSKLVPLTLSDQKTMHPCEGKTENVGRVTRERGARYVVEGRICKHQQTVRISLKLTDCNSGKQLWARHFDRGLIDALAVRDEVVRAAVAAAAVNLCAIEPCLLAPEETAAPAYDHFLRGRELFWTQTVKGNAQARRLFEQALDLAPRSPLPRAFLSAAHLMDYINGWTGAPEDSLSQSYELAKKGMETRNPHPWSHVALGNAYLWSRKHEQALVEYETAIGGDPNLAVGYVGLGWALHYVGKSEQTVGLIQLGIRLDPHYFDVRLHWLAQAYYQLGRYGEAIETLRRRLIRKPDSDVSRALLAACYGQLDETEKAWAEWETVRQLNPSFSLERRRSIEPYSDSRHLDNLFRGLSKASLVY